MPRREVDAPALGLVGEIEGPDPVGARGTIGGSPFAFRARDGSWEIEVAPGPGGDDAFETGRRYLAGDAGRMPLFEAEALIRECARQVLIERDALPLPEGHGPPPGAELEALLAELPAVLSPLLPALRSGSFVHLASLVRAQTRGMDPEQVGSRANVYGNALRNWCFERARHVQDPSCDPAGGLSWANGVLCGLLEEFLGPSSGESQAVLATDRRSAERGARVVDAATEAVYVVGGQCPVEASGRVAGERFHFHARHQWWWFAVAADEHCWLPDLELWGSRFYREGETEGRESASWLTAAEAARIISGCCREYRSDGAGAEPRR